MDIMCEDCGTVIQIPTERIPQNSNFRVTCPRCKRKISASIKNSEVTPGRGTDSASGQTSVPDGIETVGDSEEFPAQATGSLLSDHPSALLCVDRNDRRATCQSLIESLGFVTNAPITPDQA
jgi:predicted Zn finger-like uncharacterized protein